MSLKKETEGNNMTNKEAIKMLRAKLYCIELDTRGARDCNEQNCDNCPYNYEQGNMGEQKQALDMAIKALEQEPNTWSLDDARKVFMDDVYNTLDFLSTNNEANWIIESFDRVTSSIKQEPVLDKIREEIKAKIEQEEFARSVFIHEEKNTARAKQCEGRIIAYNNVIKIIDKYKTESEK